MSLLDFNDPNILTAFGLLRARHGELPGLLQSHAQGLERRKQRELQEQAQRQQMEMQRMQMEDVQRKRAEQEQIRALGSQAFAPNQNLVNMDDEGNAMPSSGGGGMQQFAQGLMGINPMLGAQFMPKPQGPIKLGINERLLDPSGRTLVDAQPEKKDWQDPAYQDFMLRKAREGRSQVNVDTRQETEFSKALGKQQGEDYAGLMKADLLASGKLNKLSRLESLLASSGNTGKLTPATMELKAAAESLGFKVDHRLPFQQAAQALSNEIALELRNPSGGAGMPGALSDRDREFLVNMVPNLAKTQGGNRILIDTMKKLAQREKEVAKLARQYRQKTGRFDEGFYQVLAEYSAKNPLFGGDSGAWSATRIDD